MLPLKTIDDFNPNGKKVIVRVDLNVPTQGTEVSDLTRIERIVPTINELVSEGAIVILLSHFGRPKGKFIAEMSLQVVIKELSKAIAKKIKFIETNWQDSKAYEAIKSAESGEVILLENVRFHPGEEKNSSEFAQLLADLGDIYVNDAFAVSHRAHASTEAIAHILPSFAGRAMEKELMMLEQALNKPEHPLVAIVGGSKISTKLDLLSTLTDKVDALVIGGGMANTFLAAQGIDIGSSLHEHDLINTARNISKESEDKGCKIYLPRDAMVTDSIEPGSKYRTTSLNDISLDEMILDVGPQTIEVLSELFMTTKTLIWNGPLGMFEQEPFDYGTSAAARIIADLTKRGNLLSVAGGGDTISALNKSGVAEGFSYISAAGGAFLEWLEGRELPGVITLLK